jgi:hypothetical protein
MNRSITPAQGRGRSGKKPAPITSKVEPGLFGGGGGYVTPRFTGTGKCNIKTEHETIDLCDSDSEPGPLLEKEKRVSNKDEDEDVDEDKNLHH